MNMSGFALRLLWRDLRGGDLNVLATAIVLAVAAATAVGFFTDRVGRAIRQQASVVLAADLVIRSPEPISAAFLDEARSHGLATAEAMSFPSVVLTGEEQSALATIDAVGPGYPLRGELKTSSHMFAAEVAVADGIPAVGEAWAEPGLLGRLGIDVGDEVQVGSRSLLVSRVLEYQPDQSLGMASLAPALLVNRDDVPAMDVLRPGSRVSFRQLFAGDEAALSAFRGSVQPRLGSEAVIRDGRDAGEQIRSAIERAERFLRLSSLVTVVLAAVATAMAARVYALRRLDMVALVKSLGATQSFLERIFALQLLLIVLGASLIGSLLGLAAQEVLARLSSGFLELRLPAVRLLPAWLGLLTAATVVMGFALPQLWHLRRTPPIRVLRRDLGSASVPAGLAYAVAVAALIGMIQLMARDLRLVALVAGGLLALAVVAGLAAWWLVRLTAGLRGMAGAAWRYGLANISRRGGESVVQVVGFGLGLMALLLLTVVRGDLLAAWQRSIPGDAPNYFLLNIEPQAWPAMQAFIHEELGSSPGYLPFIRGRLTAVNGTGAQQLAEGNPKGADFLLREQNLSWSAQLPAGNHIRSGAWWPAGHAGPPEVSLDERVAADLGIRLGDVISFSIGGEEFSATVTSTRSVEWESFSPNFFLMLSPGLAAELPQTYISSFHVPAAQRQMLNELVRRFPGVTVFDIDAILAQLRLVMSRASLAVEYVFLFTLLAGVMVLLAAIQLTRDERRAESAILRALGASRRMMLQGVATEFIVLGALGGLLAATGATIIGFLLARQVFDLPYAMSWLLWPVGLLLGAGLVGVVGMLAVWRTVDEPPVNVLRGI